MMLWRLWGILLLVGCAATPPTHPKLDQGFQLAQEGSGSQARMAFLEACSQKSTAGCFLGGKPLSRKQLKPLPILQSLTSDQTTEINILSQKTEKLEVSLWNLKTLQSFLPIKEKTEGFPDSPWVTQTVQFEGLSPNTPYSLVVLEGGQLRDTRMLKTRPTAQPSGKIAVASCMFDQFPQAQKQIWSELVSLQPDFLFFIGDTVYSDFEGDEKGISTNPSILWRRYAETRNRLEIFKSETLVPILAVWDDHDYGLNDGDRNFPHKEAAARTFRAFFPQDSANAHWENGPGVGGVLSAFGQEFYFLDGRSFRSPPGSLPQTHFGSDQEKWLWKHLGKAKRPAWLIGGDQFFGAYHTHDSFERLHPLNFADFLKRLKNLPRSIAFISGDRHMLEIMQLEKSVLGYPTYEFTTSGIQAQVFPGAFKKLPNRRRIGGADDSQNYLLLETSGTKQLKIHATGYGPGKKVLFDKKMTVR